MIRQPWARNLPETINLEGDISIWPVDVQNVTGHIIGRDYEAAMDANITRHLRGHREEPLEVTYKMIRLQCLRGISGRHSLNFARIPDNTWWSCWYLLDMDVTDFRSVCGARLDSEILSIDEEGRLNEVGSFSELLDESPKERLKRLYDERGFEAFSGIILHNESGDYIWDRRNGLELLRSGEIDVDEYLDKAAFVYSPYRIDTPKKIEDLKGQRFVEWWCADVSFGGHVQ